MSFRRLWPLSSAFFSLQLLATPIPTEPPFGGQEIDGVVLAVLEKLEAEAGYYKNPPRLTQPFPNKFRIWVKELESHMAKLKSMKDEDKACYGYFLEEKILMSMPEHINRYPELIEQVKKIGIKMGSREMYGSFHEPNFRTMAAENLPHTYCGRLALLSGSLRTGEGLGPYEVSQKLINRANEFLKAKDLPADMRILAEFYRAQAYLARWLGASKKRLVPGEECRVQASEAPESNRTMARQLFQEIAKQKHELASAAHSTLAWMDKGDIEGRYTIKYCVWND